MIKVEPETRDEILKKHFQNGRTIISLSEEYGLSQSVINRLIKTYREECQLNTVESENLRLMEENRKLKEKQANLEKEVDFLKKAAAFFAKDQ